MKNITPDEVHNKWLRAEYPFDTTPNCTNCLTMHAEGSYFYFCCARPDHDDLRTAVAAAGLGKFYTALDKGVYLAANYEKFLQLREKYAHLFRQEVPR